VVRGYFDNDRNVELGDLAAEIEISKSALSQRLRAAQAKLVTDVFDEGREVRHCGRIVRRARLGADGDQPDR